MYALYPMSMPIGKRSLTFMLQHRMLYVFDATAMHNIIVKDQYIYEEAAFFIQYAYRILLVYYPN